MSFDQLDNSSKDDLKIAKPKKHELWGYCHKIFSKKSMKKT